MRNFNHRHQLPVAITCCDLTSEMRLLVEEILQLQVQAVDLRLGFGSDLFRVSYVEDNLTVKASQLRKSGCENFLLLRQIQSDVFRWFD